MVTGNKLDNRQHWTDEDFRTIFALIGDLRVIFRDCPEKAAEYAPVILDDLDRAGNALLYIARGTGALTRPASD